MKKKIIVMLLCVTTACAGLFVGCGAKDEAAPVEVEESEDAEESEELEEESEELESEDTEAADGSVAAGEKYANVEAMCEDPQVKAGLDQLMESMNSDSMEVAITAEGNTMTYTFKIKNVEYSDDVVAALQQAAEGTEEQLAASKEEFQTVIEEPGVKMCLVYLDMNGKEILTLEF